MNVYQGNRPETGNTLKWHPFDDASRGGYFDGFIKTPACTVQAMAMHSDNPYGWLSANFNGRYFQHAFADKPSKFALIKRAHAMMRTALAGITEETY